MINLDKRKSSQIVIDRRSRRNYLLDISYAWMIFQAINAHTANYVHLICRDVLNSPFKYLQKTIKND